jgi:hypothetical protein
MLSLAQGRLQGWSLCPRLQGKMHYISHQLTQIRFSTLDRAKSQSPNTTWLCPYLAAADHVPDKKSGAKSDKFSETQTITLVKIHQTFRQIILHVCVRL